MSIEVDLQIASNTSNLPKAENLESWVNTALSTVSKDDLELTLRIVDEDEMQSLNREYRNQDKPTNVLSFPFDDPPGIKTTLLGDILICAPVVEREAKDYGVDLNEHWAHMVVHGILHLCGYDHMQTIEATEMAKLELQILEKIGFYNRQLSRSVLG